MKIELKDGSIILPIMVSQHLNETTETTSLVQEKLKTYLSYLSTEEGKIAKSTIVEFKCIKAPDLKVQELINSFRPLFKELNAELTWKF